MTRKKNWTELKKLRRPVQVARRLKSFDLRPLRSRSLTRSAHTLIAGAIVVLLFVTALVLHSFTATIAPVGDSALSLARPSSMPISASRIAPGLFSACAPALSDGGRDRGCCSIPRGRSRRRRRPGQGRGGKALRGGAAGGARCCPPPAARKRVKAASARRKPPRRRSWTRGSKSFRSPRCWSRR